MDKIQPPKENQNINEKDSNNDDEKSENVKKLYD